MRVLEVYINESIHYDNVLLFVCLLSCSIIILKFIHIAFEGSYLDFAAHF